MRGDNEAKPAGLTVRVSRWIRPKQPLSISTNSNKNPHRHCVGLSPLSPLLSLTAISGAATAPPVSDTYKARPLFSQ